jgi:hypothetical protein
VARAPPVSPQTAFAHPLRPQPTSTRPTTRDPWKNWRPKPRSFRPGLPASGPGRSAAPALQARSFGCPLPAAEMRLQCRCTQVLDCKGVYCSAHNAAVPSGIRDSESVGPGQTRIRPDHRRATAPAPPPIRAAVAGAAAQSSSALLGGFPGGGF